MKANSNIPQPAQSATDGRMHVRRNAVLHADCLACAENSTLFSCAFALVFSAARMLMAIVAVLLLMLLPLAARAFAQRATPHADSVVAQPVIDMFSKPSLDSDVISQAIYGANIVTLAHQGEWAQIRTADEYTGWVEAKNLRKLPAAGYPAADRLVQITALGANVYREPDLTKHAPVLRLPWEALLEAIPDAPGNTERWLAVRLADGQTAWVQHGDATTAPRTLGIDETLQLARRFLGITYTWGGVSSFGFDCSGFTQMLVRQRGTLMPRDADVQAGWKGVEAVAERKDLQPGDLLFFGSSAEKITHTGMYIGQGEFIHDTVHEHPGVQISKLDDPYWSHLLVAMRRVKP